MHLSPFRTSCFGERIGEITSDLHFGTKAKRVRIYGMNDTIFDFVLRDVLHLPNIISHHLACTAFMHYLEDKF
jgi:hypothetical protein